jgi:hypothetical protein
MNSGERDRTEDARLAHTLVSRSHCIPTWTIVVIALLSLQAIGDRPLRLSTRTGELKHEAENGAAALTYRVPLNRSFVFSADLELPKIPANQSWYAVWLMIGELKNTAQYPSMLQVGLVRWDQSGFEVQPFVASEHSGHPELNFTPVRTNLAGVHRFAISSNPTTIDLLMDGRVLMSGRRRDFFADSSPTYLKVAAEVFADGDKVSGRVTNIQIQVDSAGSQAPSAWDAFEDRGLKFECHPKGIWEATGVFDPRSPFSSYLLPRCN